MNAPQPFQSQGTPVGSIQSKNSSSEDEIYLREYWDIIVDNRWLVSGIAALGLTLGLAYAFLAKPVYESNLLIQVEDSAASAKSFLGEAASLFDVKTPASAEIEIIRSRMVIGRAVDATVHHVRAVPHRLPFIGDWLARKADTLSNPGLLGFGGWVHGKESISVAQFDVPPEYENEKFSLKVTGEKTFTLDNDDLATPASGEVGKPLKVQLGTGEVVLNVASFAGNVGAEFRLTRMPRLEAIEDLQDDLKLVEKGRQSGVIDASLRDTDRDRLLAILNEIGAQYVRQNVERKAAEAQKTLAFLDVQLPEFKKQLEKSEEAYNKYRNQQGTVSLDEEAKLVLAQSVDLQARLFEAQQKRRELVSRFTSEHPSVKALDDQIAAWNREINALNSKIRALPAVQQDAVRLERDVKVNNELFQQLRNNALQLQLIREGKIGNVRLLDQAAMPLKPVRPKKGLTAGAALIAGLFMGVVAAFIRSTWFRGVRSPQEVEAQTGLSVYTTIPLSEAQQVVAQRVAAKAKGMHVLAEIAPRDVAVEALRSLRTAIQFTMLEASNNRVLITGGTPGVGKSFVSSNFAAVMASAGRRVLLIDADLRKGHLNQYFGITRENGLAEAIAGLIPQDSAVRRAVLPNLDFIPTGHYPPNPAELLVSAAFGHLLDSMSETYDLVIIDSAPVLVAADTTSIATRVGTLFLVARADQTFVGDIIESVRQLSHAGKSPTGVLFNAMDLTRRHYGRYTYRYGAYNYANYRYKYGVDQDTGRS